jgi:hypothetical protein
MFVLPSTRCPLRAPRLPPGRSLQCALTCPSSPHPLCCLGRLRHPTPSLRWKMNTSRRRCGYMSHSKWSPIWTRLKISGRCHPRSFPSVTFSMSKFGRCSWLSKRKTMPHHCLKSLHGLRWMKSVSRRRFYCILPSK